MNKKEEIILQIAALLAQLISEDGDRPAAAEVPKEDSAVEMLTIKECTETVRVYRSIRFVSLWRRVSCRTYAQDRASGERYL